MNLTNENGATEVKHNPLVILKLEAEWLQQQKDYQLQKAFVFTNRSPPLFIALCQMFAAIFTEVINMAVISSSNQAMDVVMNYIALGIIAEIDNLYANSMEMVTFVAIKASGSW